MKNLTILLSSILVISACSTVEQHEAGVARTRFSGTIHENVVDQGLRSIVGKSIHKYNLREIQYPEDATAEVVSVLTKDQLQVNLEVAHMWRIMNSTCVREIWLNIGTRDDLAALVHKTYRDAVRDAVAEVDAAILLSEGRQGLGGSVRNLMNNELETRCVEVTEFFIRDIQPPPVIRQAVEEKLAREQEVQSQVYQTQVVMEQANQKREEAEGLRDAQAIIAESLVGERGERYLYWRAMEAMESLGDAGNMVVVPTEGGVPIFMGAPNIN